LHISDGDGRTRTVIGPPWTAEFLERRRRFSKAEDKEIEVDCFLYAAHSFHNPSRFERVWGGMGRRELRADLPGTHHELKHSLF